MCGPPKTQSGVKTLGNPHVLADLVLTFADHFFGAPHLTIVCLNLARPVTSRAPMTGTRDYRPISFTNSTLPKLPETLVTSLLPIFYVSLKILAFF